MSSIGDFRFSDSRSLFLAWSTFKGPRETFDSWYDETHIPQILSAPGMVGAQRFVLDDTPPVPGTTPVDYGHLALYEINGDPGGFRQEVKRQLMSEEMVIPDFMNPPFKTLILEPASEPASAGTEEEDNDLADRHLLIEFSRPTGDYEPYAEWYDQVYIPRLLDLPGVFRVQRFMQSEVKPLPGVDTPDVYHLTLCELSGSPSALREQLAQSGDIADSVQQPVGATFMRPASPFISAVASQG
jgi:hypothetical protein